MMTKEEKELIQLLGKSFTLFMVMKQLHPDDRHEFRTHIHALQNMVAMRQAQRDNPDLFWSEK